MVDRIFKLGFKISQVRPGNNHPLKTEACREYQIIDRKELEEVLSHADSIKGAP